MTDIQMRGELLMREYRGGTTVTNCVIHMGRDLTDRPEDCRLCHTDVSNALARAIRINEWLNRWKDDASDYMRSLPADA